MKKSIALVFPPSTFLTNPMVWPPLGLFYLASQLEAQGHKVDFFDLSVDNKPFPKDGDFDQLWLSATSPQMFAVRRIAEETKWWKKTATVFGGAAPWADPKGCSTLPFNLIVSGEADHPNTITEIVSSANRNRHETIYPRMSKDLSWVIPPKRDWTLEYHSYMKDHQGGLHRMASIFTTRGCPMSCSFCIEENQRVLMADWTWKPIKDIQVGDMVMGMDGGQHKNKYPVISPTRVLSVWDRGVKETIAVSDGESSLRMTPDHKIYAHDGYKTRWKLAQSVIPDKYSFRKFAPYNNDCEEFRRGWIAGYLAGDGCVHKRNNKTNITITSRDIEMLDILQQWSAEFGFTLRKFQHKMGNSIFPTKLSTDYIDGVQCTSGVESDQIVEFLREKEINKDYCAGWLAGMYDSDGTLDVGRDCRIFQSYKVKPHNTVLISRYLQFLGIPFTVHERGNGGYTYRMGQSDFVLKCRPLMKRKLPISYDYRTLPQTVARLISTPSKATVYDIETESHSFIAEGFIVHNCESGRNGVIWDSMVRYEPLHVVEEQIRQIRDLGFTGLAYYDDIFILNRKRTEALLDLHKKYGMVFRCFLRSDILSKHGGKEYLQAMVDGGLIEIFIGVESASNQIKNNIHKGTTIEQDEAVLQWCKELGVTCKMSFILGLPGETKETMEDTRSWILKNRPHITQVDRLIPFPGTPLTNHVGQYDLQYERVPEEEWFFRGRHDISSKSFVSTSHLTASEIDIFWHNLEQELIREGLSGYGH